MLGLGGSHSVRVGGLKGEEVWTQTPRRMTWDMKAEAETGVVPHQELGEAGGTLP